MTKLQNGNTLRLQHRKLPRLLIGNTLKLKRRKLPQLSSLSKQTALSGSSGSCARRVDDKEDFEDIYEKVYHHAPFASTCVSPASDLSFSEEPADYTEVPTIVLVCRFKK
jgi:4-diphosphocytidyl-2C-methyl-D-erythritol kinase